MIVSIHQPNFVPWLGYFYKILRCDIFIILDDTQYTKNSFINRNRIKTPQGALWLTIPAAPKLGTAIHEVEIKDTTWPEKVAKTLKANYSRAKFFDEIFEPLIEGLQRKPNHLCSTNTTVLELVMGWLELPCKMVRASEHPTAATGDGRLVQLVKGVGGRTYLSGYGGRSYQSEATFTEAGLACRYYDFSPPLYPQLWGEFVPGLSVVDCLFNCGTRGTADLLRRSGKQPA